MGRDGEGQRLEPDVRRAVGEDGPRGAGFELQLGPIDEVDGEEVRVRRGAAAEPEVQREALEVADDRDVRRLVLVGGAPRAIACGGSSTIGSAVSPRIPA